MRAHRARLPRRNRSMALIVVLITVALCSVLAVSFLVSSRFDMSSSNAYYRSLAADELARGAAMELIAQLRQEAVQGGANPLSTPLPVRIAVTNPVRGSPLIRFSTNLDAGSFAAAFAANGVTPPTNYASALPATAAGSDGHYIAAARWQLPQFLRAGQAAPLPGWVFVTRSGPTLEADPAKLSSLNATNQNAVIGRYAYAIYETDGLLDANVAGTPTLPGIAGEKGSSALADLAPVCAAAGVNPNGLAAFFSWRDANWLQDVYGTDPQPGQPGSAGFLELGFRNLTNHPDYNFFVGRQDLLQYAAANPGALPAALLPYLTTFSRSANAPEIPEATPGNAACLDNATAVTLPSYALDGTARSYNENAGDPFLQRKFPLARLRWFEQHNNSGTPTPSYTAAIKQHFGLTWSADLSGSGISAPEYQQVPGWVYTSPDGNTPATAIKQLSDIQGKGREPDFFEWLKAGILAASLGINQGVNNSSVAVAQDSSADFQVIQIGANIIAQSGSDDVPFLIASAAAADRTGGPLVASGVKSLPYVSEILQSWHRPAATPGTLTAYLQFQFWNPHQNASRVPVDSGKNALTFRVRAIEGTAWADAYARINNTDTTSTVLSQVYTASAARRTIVPRTFSGGATDTLSFAYGDMDFSEPRLLEKSSTTNTVPLKLQNRQLFVGPAPESTTTFQGIAGPSALAANPAIPPGTRMPAGGSIPTSLDDPATGLASTYPMGEKPYNATKFALSATSVSNPPAGSTPAPLSFVAEVLANGHWMPYQALERLSSTFQVIEHPGSIPYYPTGTPVLTWQPDLPVGSLPGDWHFYNWSNPPFPGGGTGTQQSPEIATMTNPTSGRLFYGWTDFHSRYSVEKIDPRTRRWGLPDMQYGSPGTSMRAVSTAFSGSAVTANWDAPFLYGSTNSISSINNIVPTPPSTPVAVGTAVPIADLARNLTSSSARYKDADGVQRPGDWAYLADAAFPSIPGQTAARPVILNRPLRSPADLGYVFRDTPWKTLDFFEPLSADFKLLDVFCVEDSYAAAGKVNPNTAPAEVLQGLLNGAALNSAPFAITNSTAIMTNAPTVAAAITNGLPVRGTAALMTQLAAAGAYTNGVPGKIAREAGARALSGSTDSRTWNFMIDVIAQSGRLVPAASLLSQFTVTGEHRYWVHVAIDRMTGRIVDIQFEPVYE